MTDGRTPERQILSEQFIHAVSGIFGCLGRALVCLDRNLDVVHASDGLDALAGEGASTEVLGLPAGQLFGEELFGESGSLRRALLAGERREGWGASLTVGGRASRLMSVTAAPISGIDSPLCDPRVAYLVVLRSAEDATVSDTAPPTLFSGMVGRSSAMLRIFRLVQSLADSDSTVLITGESGTGKELVARALHQHSPRRTGPFVAVNCGALPGELLESELFGHVRGAFTGAIRDRVGRFELAGGGTLFLDEVGDLPLPLQVKLLRVLQERTFEPVGESRSRRTDARIIAATHRHLTREVAEGRFREDLYYRLRVVPIAMPPLRERREDIEPLALHLLARVGAQRGRALILAPDALRALLRYPWPGNARELENALEYAVAVCPGQTIHRGDLPVEVAEPDAAPPAADAAREPGLESSAPPGDDERARLRSVLDQHRWNREAAARALGISRTTLWRRMREAGLAD
jgi:transcriptional regulator with GAF, ATPase, and Fis domain